MCVVKRIKNAIKKFLNNECRKANKRRKKNEKPGNVIFYRTYFLTFCINHILITLATKTIAYVCLATNPTALPKKNEIAPAKYPTIAGNSLTVFPAKHLRVSDSLFICLLVKMSLMQLGLSPPFLQKHL